MSNVAISFPYHSNDACKNRRSGFADERGRDDDGDAEKCAPVEHHHNRLTSPTSKDNPVQIAADAAEGAWRGFDEQETTVAVARYAPFNAIALLVGSQVGRPGILTQCSLEEATELKLGMLGHTCYAETISVYGTEPVFTDGDDTPWSKGFLASSYASRGLKMRFTSGSGSEVQMGYAEGKSMLYLEARCIYIHQSRRRSGSAEWFGKAASVFHQLCHQASVQY